MGCGLVVAAWQGKLEACLLLGAAHDVGEALEDADVAAAAVLFQRGVEVRERPLADRGAALGTAAAVLRGAAHLQLLQQLLLQRGRLRLLPDRARQPAGRLADGGLRDARQLRARRVRAGGGSPALTALSSAQTVLTTPTVTQNSMAKHLKTPMMRLKGEEIGSLSLCHFQLWMVYMSLGIRGHTWR